MHLLVNFPPNVAVSRLINSPKGVSSSRLLQEFPDLVRHYWRAKRLWSGSYFAGSIGGAPLSIVQQYIEQQYIEQQYIEQQYIEQQYIEQQNRRV